MKVPRIICFSAHKGGVGKTTSAVNAAVALALNKKNVLVIDVDPQGHSTKSLGVELEYKEPNIADVLPERGISLSEVIKSTHYPTLSVVPSNLRLSRVAESLYGRMKREEILTRLLEPLLGDYEWIVIDCPPHLGVLTTNAITASDIIVIPCQMGGARSLEGLEDQLESIQFLKGKDFDNWRILRVMIDPRKRVALEASRQLLAPYEAQGKLFETQIQVNEPLNQAQFVDQDIFSFDAKSRGAEDYQAFAKELIERYS